MRLHRTKIARNPYISVFALVFMIAWVSSLPTRFISFSPTIPIVEKVLNGLFFTASNIAGIVLGWLITRKSLNLRSKLLLTSLLALIGTVVLHYTNTMFQGVTILVLFLLFGIFVAAISQVVQTQIPAEYRVLTIGFLTFSRALLAFVTYPKYQNLNPLKPFSSSLILIIIVMIASCFIQQDSLLAVTTPQLQKGSRKAVLSLAYLYLYFVILSVTKGLIIQQLSYHTLFATTNLSISIFASYSIAVFFVLMASSKPNLRVILYFANSLLIIAVLAFSLTRDSKILLVSVNILLYFSFAVNELFCFHSFFVIGDILRNGALTFGLTFSVNSLGMLVGKMLAEYNHTAQIVSIESLIVLLFSVLTIILPPFLIQLTKLSTDSIFRINSIDSDPMLLESNCNRLYEVDPAAKHEASNIYPQINNYDKLTNREKEVLDLLLKGYPSELIASTLFISNNTLKRHVQNIYNKFNVHSRTELFRLSDK